MHHDFDGMTDEEIALLAQQGDADASEYLLNKYKNFVRSKARSYFLVGADHEDIVQEGMIRLVGESCDKVVTLPMKGKIESLNASVAAGILLYAMMDAK